MPSKQPTKKNVQVNTGPSAKTALALVLEARQIKKVCDGSAAYLGSATCQSAMGTWMSACDALDANLQSQKTKRGELLALEDQEETLVMSFLNGRTGFAVAVQGAASGDPAIVTEMGMTARAEAFLGLTVTVPEGVAIVFLKTTGEPRLTWSEVPGAVLYTVQMSVDPATDTSWTTIFGRGKSRKLPPLVAGQHYLFRVCAIGNDGKPSGWSQIVAYVAT